MKKTKIKGVIFLLLTAFIWGLAFVAQSVGMESVEAFTFGTVRTLMGVAALLPVILIKDHIASKKMTDKQLDERKLSNKKALVYGSLLGVVFCLASSLQQQAFNYSDAGKIAFITAIYIFFVPLLGLFFKNRVSALMWGCVAIGFVGLYFLCIDGSSMTSINLGDILALLCAFFFAIHILLIEKFTVGTDGLKLSCVQFFVSSVLSAILMFLFESPSWSAILAAIVPLLYAGVMSCGVAYTFQIIGQKYTDSAMASLIMCMESVFAVVASSIMLHERMSLRETAGCIIMFVAILLPNLVALIQQRKK